MCGLPQPLLRDSVLMFGSAVRCAAEGSDRGSTSRLVPSQRVRVVCTYRRVGREQLAGEPDSRAPTVSSGTSRSRQLRVCARAMSGNVRSVGRWRRSAANGADAAHHQALVDCCNPAVQGVNVKGRHRACLALSRLALVLALIGCADTGLQRIHLSEIPGPLNLGSAELTEAELESMFRGWLSGMHMEPADVDSWLTRSRPHRPGSPSPACCRSRN